MRAVQGYADFCAYIWGPGAGFGQGPIWARLADSGQAKSSRMGPVCKSNAFQTHMKPGPPQPDGIRRPRLLAVGAAAAAATLDPLQHAEVAVDRLARVGPDHGAL